MIRLGKEKFYFPLDELKDGKKTEFLTCRMERDLFLKLSKKAQLEGTDLSSIIRTLCRQGLN